MYPDILLQAFNFGCLFQFSPVHAFSKANHQKFDSAVTCSVKSEHCSINWLMIHVSVLPSLLYSLVYAPSALSFFFKNLFYGQKGGQEPYALSNLLIYLRYNQSGS